MLRFGIILGTLVVLADQTSKLAATRWLPGRSVVIVEDFFDLILVHNLGAAFGLFTGLPALVRDMFLAGVALGATVFILVLLHRADSRWSATALGLVLGGAMGNLIDRLRLGWVVDFIHWHWHDLSWPVFNLADAAITVGVSMLIWDNLKSERRVSPPADPAHWPEGSPPVDSKDKSP
ncbi:MAG: signal peptidase II [Magnetococcus sp. WYHC-3]